MKNILTKEQFEKWEYIQKVKMRNSKKRMAKAKRNNNGRENNEDRNFRKPRINRS